MFVQNLSEQAASQMEGDGNTAVVSITDPGRVATLAKGFAAVLRLQFLDVNDEQPAAIQPLHAKEIASFVREEQARGHNLLIHCGAGVSRSGAVAEIILQMFPDYQDLGWPRSPNERVARLLKKAFNGCG